MGEVLHVAFGKAKAQKLTKEQAEDQINSYADRIANGLVNDSPSLCKAAIEEAKEKGIDFKKLSLTFPVIKEIDDDGTEYKMRSIINLYLLAIHYGNKEIVELLFNESSFDSLSSFYVTTRSDDGIFVPGAYSFAFNNAGDYHWAALSQNPNAVENLTSVRKARGYTIAPQNNHAISDIIMTMDPKEHESMTYTPLDVAIINYVSQQFAINMDIKRKHINIRNNASNIRALLSLGFKGSKKSIFPSTESSILTPFSSAILSTQQYSQTKKYIKENFGEMNLIKFCYENKNLIDSELWDEIIATIAPQKASVTSISTPRNDSPTAALQQN